ncbi:hypothetical protein [Erwinia endophytica]|nr:hypothetical protein [Erwinia endophytica]
MKSVARDNPPTLVTAPVLFQRADIRLCQDHETIVTFSSHQQNQAV